VRKLFARSNFITRRLYYFGSVPRNDGFVHDDSAINGYELGPLRRRCVRDGKNDHGAYPIVQYVRNTAAAAFDPPVLPHTNLSLVVRNVKTVRGLLSLTRVYVVGCNLSKCKSNDYFRPGQNVRASRSPT